MCGIQIPDYHHWEFRNCFSCVGLTSQYCAENGGSCCNSCENDEEDEDDPMTIDAPPLSPNGACQMPHGFVYTAYGILNTRFPFVYSSSRYSGSRPGLRDDEAEIFTVHGSRSN